MSPTPQTPPTDRPLTAGDGNAPCPGGWLIKDFADGWYWTPHRIAAVAALTEGHAVHPLVRPAASEGVSTHRWNIERDGEDLLICDGEHEKGEGCTYDRYTLASPPAREEAPAEGAGDELDLYDDKVQAGIAWTLRQVGEALGLTTWTQGDGSESVEGDVGAEIHTILVDAGLRDPETNEMAALRNRTSEPEAGEAHKVEWVNDASNVNDRRMYIDGQQWAKVYGWDEVSLNARCDALQIAMQNPAPATADKLKVAVGSDVGAVARLERAVNRWSIRWLVNSADMENGALLYASPKQIDKLEATRLNWVVGKGTLREEEPPFGCQILDGTKVVAEGEGTSINDAIDQALAALTEPSK